MKSAKRVITVINNNIIFDSKLVIGNYDANYIIHNNSGFRGCIPDGILENYLYGWSFSSRFCDGIKIIEGEYKEVVFPKELHLFEQIPELNLIFLFIIKAGRFKDFDSINITKEGLVKISSTSTNRSLDIKIGRFVKALVDDNKEFINKYQLFDVNSINTNTYERITNKCKEILNDKLLKFEIVNGDDILKGYTKDNYFIKENSSSLAGSCMGDKLHLLDLYTKNSAVELAIVYMFDKIVARCLLWETSKGKYYDVIYSNFQWVEPFLISNLEKLGIKSTENGNNYCVKLDYVPDDNYPYLDTFCYLNSYKDYLYDEYAESNWDKLLRETDGGWEDYCSDSYDDYEEF